MIAIPEPIAIIGSGCRFPGASNSPSKLWELLNNPRDVLQEFPDERLKLSNFYHPNKGHHGSTDVKNKSYLLTEDHRLFDASFFNTNPLEAACMDPAQRILLETVYETIEAAGYTMEQMQGTLTSVFVGLMSGDYWDITLRDTETMPTYTASGMSRSIMSNRISYVFDLRGPSMTIDTACSSSLVALHQAVQSLRTGECTSAIVAGANILLDASTYIMETKLQMLSPDSRCRMWDKSADGYARGEGFAAVLLKPLSAALADGDDIECVIRETGVNSDGRTKGIAMPSAEAQATLIRRTYEKAGLDPIADRCQYFECHGTGTQAGDPVEARAIADTFFPRSQEHGDAKMYVGSIKTIIGHLEGCAGLAGVLKASLAVQNRTIPPNMHFNELNPSIQPFYEHLEILKSSVPWPQTNGPRRASVNSFGFGGVNGHVIIENYEPKATLRTESPREHFTGPLVFSARSEQSLAANIRNLAAFIKLNEEIDLSDVAWVLQKKRSTFPIKHFFPELDRSKLLESMDSFIQSADSGSISSLVTRTPSRSSDKAPGILGIFTGQGAQWAGMGTALIRRCRLFRESIDHCEASLAALPDPPPWSLKDELMARDTSRISEAALSQPLCTAIQIAAIDLVASVGIEFTTVVGHSSGEIAAAYAAGILSAADAMAIAYYRGHHAKLAQGADPSEKGSMMAVGMSYAAALELCSQPRWAGRMGVAASNSPSSVTLSGDRDMIEQALVFFEEQKTFARKLQVDTAYHSHHMLPCAGPYLESLRACNITVKKPIPGRTWISSVYGDSSLLNSSLDGLAGQYWVDNMVKPVLFSQAVDFSLRSGSTFEMAVEIGPHPTLKGPATQTLKSALGSSLPYTGLMRRGEDDVQAFSSGVGSLWANLGPSFIEFAGYRKAFDAVKEPRMVKGLPTYAWDHDKIYWKEGRVSRNLRLRAQTPHELLGRRTPDDSDYEMRWRNFLRLQELPWIRGHEFQGQTLFPAAGHVSMALEAARRMANNRSVRLFELRNISIRRALVVEEDHSGVEIVFTLRRLNDEFRAECSDKNILEAKFSSYACSDEEAGQLEKVACGTVVLHLGDSTGQELPRIAPTRRNLTPVDTNRVYSRLTDIGLNYQGMFRTMQSAERTMGYCKASALWQDYTATDYLIHPAILDAALQAMFVALASPASNGSLWTTFLPSSMERITVDPVALLDCSSPTLETCMEAFITESSSASFTGDVHLLNSTGTRASVQVEGLLFKAIAEASPANDRSLFAKTVWDVDIARGASVALEEHKLHEELELVHALERVALFYLKDLVNSVSKDEIEHISWYHQKLFAATEAALSRIQSGHHPTVQQEWLDDTRETIEALHDEFPHQVDLKMLRAIGSNLVSSVRGETQILEVMLKDDLLSQYYQGCWGNEALNKYVARLIQQITHKHPRAGILEVGAGTGGTTRSILDAIGTAYSSYTYTDISSGFFGKAADKFHGHNMTFKVLDIEKPPDSQGFAEGTYEIVIAANVLHATRSMTETLKHTRSLLKPGGYLVLLEITADALRNLLIFGTLPGWWLGAEEGRNCGPFISDVQWDGLLRRSGFSGVDAVLRDLPDARTHSTSVMLSQAIDDTVRLLRDPMPAVPLFDQERVLIVGGKTLPVLKLVRGVQDLLPSWKPSTTVVESLDALDTDILSPNTSVIFLGELDQPLFAEAMTDIRLRKLQHLFTNAKTVLCVTKGCLAGDSPESNMMLGIGRALLTELPHLILQFLDVTKLAHLTSRIIVECFLRLAICATPETSGHDMLWTTEPELLLDGNAILLPRVVPDKDINDRFNANRRLITKTVSTTDTCVEIAASAANELISLQEVPSSGVLGTAAINVEYSCALSRDSTIVLGTVRGTSVPALGVWSTGSSTIYGSGTGLQILPEGSWSTPSTVLNVASHVLALELLKLIPRGYAAMIHEPPASLAVALSQVASVKEISIFFSTCDNAGAGTSWLHFHPLATDRAVRALIPRTVRCFIDLSSSTTTRLPLSPPRGSIFHKFNNCEELISDPAHIPLKEALVNAITLPLSHSAEETVINVQQLAGAPHSSSSYPNVVDWRQSELEVPVSPLDPSRLFRPDRTYFMVGMTGELGRSLARWMIDNGARYVVLTSRTADVDATWLKDMTALGATVKICQMDVSDTDSVKLIHDKVQETLPPIAGVCNAAMVLSDALFLNMDAESLNKVLLPKVTGTKVLNEIFNKPDLDFFVLFSSLASVFGNAGQSNYHAANLFMTSLAAERRRKGLAASIMHIGMVVDIGYVARAGRHIEDHLRKLLYHPMSEADLQHLFAEAVMHSHPDTKGTWNIVSGIDPFVDTPDALTRPRFYSNPRFSHFIHEDTASKQQSRSSLPSKDMKQQLQEASSEEDVKAVIQEAFLSTLELMLQMAPNTVEPSSSLMSLGMDSLVAVEIRTWFLKNVHVDIPVLQLLGGDTVTAICVDATRKYTALKTSKA